MNNIGFGIFCFGDEIYFKGTLNKINEILNNGYHCYVLTDDVNFFTEKYGDMFLHIIPYKREIKSYSDKIILPKYILEKHDIAILIDADTLIKDNKSLHLLKNYQFKDGISYIDTLLSHNSKKEFVKDLININNIEWKYYDDYIKKIYPNYGELETIWEYFIVFNKSGFDIKKFYSQYEKLQLVKEYSDLLVNKTLCGAGEGISIFVSALLSNTPIIKDMDLKSLLGNQIEGISRYYPKKA